MQHRNTRSAGRSRAARTLALTLAGAAAVAASLVALPASAAASSSGSPPGARISNVPAQEPSTSGISVTGTGSAVVVPDVATIEFVVSASAKSMLQAMQEFKGKRALFEKAMIDFDEDGVTLEPGGLRIGLRSNRNNNFVVMNGEAAPSAPYEASELVKVRMPMGEGGASALDMLAEIIASADDVEVRLEGPDPNRYYSSRDQEPSPITFTASDESLVAARSAALAAAYEDAVKQADELAQLAGARLGPAVNLKSSKALAKESKTAGADERQVTLDVRFELIR